MFPHSVSHTQMTGVPDKAKMMEMLGPEAYKQIMEEAAKR